MIHHYKKIFLIGSLSILSMVSLAHLSNQPKNNFMPHSAHTIYDNNQKPSTALLELLKLLNIEHDGTWQNICKATQATWLRKDGSERWNLEDIHGDKKEAVIELLTRMGCVQEAAPHHKNYDHALVLGATVQRVRSRLAYLIELWNRGIRFNEVVFLGSERSLDPKLESKEVLTQLTYDKLPTNPQGQFKGELPKTEYEMMKMVCEQTQFPAGLDTLKKVFINTPMQTKPNGQVVRANTLDTIYDWQNNHKPQPNARCLFVSNQPYVGYQDAAVRTALPSTFNIETVGHAASGNDNIAVHLDNLARWIYQEQKVTEKNPTFPS